jgi:hypothetical protein
VELDETLTGGGSQQLRFVREVAIRCGGADAGASCHLSQRERFRALLLHQRERGLCERALEIAVVIGVTLRFRGGVGNLLLPRHVDNANMQ